MVLFGVSRLAGNFGEGESTLSEIIESRLYPYVGFITVMWGGIVFVKAARILAFEYLLR